MKKLLAALFALFLAAPAFAQGIAGGGGGSSSGGVTAGCGIQGTSTISIGGISKYSGSGAWNIAAGTYIAETAGGALGSNLTVNLPSAASQGTCPLWILDSAGIVSTSSHVLTITVNGADTININSSTLSMGTQLGAVELQPDGVSNWTVAVDTVIVATTCSGTTPYIIGLTSAGVVTCGGTKAALSIASLAATTPTGTAQTTFKMMGLGFYGCAITPVFTGNVQLTISGVLRSSVAGDGYQAQMSYGTGTAPQNAAAASGTVVGSNYYGAGLAPQAFTSTVTITGLSLNTAYWFDLQAEAVTAGTTTIEGATCSALEY